MNKLSLVQKAEFFTEFCNTFDEGSLSELGVAAEIRVFKRFGHKYPQDAITLREELVKSIRRFKRVREVQPYYYAYRRLLRQRHTLVNNNKEESHGHHQGIQLEGVNG